MIFIKQRIPKLLIIYQLSILHLWFGKLIEAIAKAMMFHNFLNIWIYRVNFWIFGYFSGKSEVCRRNNLILW